MGLGLGGTEHGDALREGEVGRKGISCEQTFRCAWAELYSPVCGRPAMDRRFSCEQRVHSEQHLFCKLRAAIEVHIIACMHSCMRA